MKVYWKIRLAFQWLLTACGLNGVLNLSMMCQRCGKSARKWEHLWWAENSVWESVMGNVNGHRHGIVCARCFTAIGKENGIWIDWAPVTAAKAKED